MWIFGLIWTLSPFEEQGAEAFVTKVDHVDLVTLRLTFLLKRTLNRRTRVLSRCTVFLSRSWPTSPR